MTLLPLGIIFLTYQRTEYALRTIHSVKRNLRYDGPIHWVVADDDSSPAHFHAVRDTIGECFDSRSERAGYGANVNWAKVRLSSSCGSYLLLEDDWVMPTEFNVTPYASLIEKKKEHIGFIRLAHLPVGLMAHSVGHNGMMFLNIQKNKQYAFSGNPHLTTFHAHTVYGPYPTGKNPGDTEIAYDGIVRGTPGPEILWPLAIGENPPFRHIGETKSYG